MKNSKRFPGEEWLADSFLAPAQLSTCRSLLTADKSAMNLAVVELAALHCGGQELQETHLTQAEQVRLASFTFAKRQREWLGGRIAAKYAAYQLLPLPVGGYGFQALQVDNDPAGRPFLRAREGGIGPWRDDCALPQISISHSSGIAAALAVERYPCGLDIQKITRQAVAVSDRFISPAEQEIISSASTLADKDEEESLSLVWAAKESLRKAFPCQPLLGFREALLEQMEAVDRGGGLIARFRCPRVTPERVPVFLLRCGEYACAIAVNRLS